MLLPIIGIQYLDHLLLIHGIGIQRHQQITGIQPDSYRKIPRLADLELLHGIGYKNLSDLR